MGSGETGRVRVSPWVVFVYPRKDGVRETCRTVLFEGEESRDGYVPSGSRKSTGDSEGRTSSGGGYGV